MNRQGNVTPSPRQVLVQLKNVSISTPGGRNLFRGLNMVMEKEKVAVIGRNGVGKSTLLQTIAGDQQPDKGEIHRHGRCCLVHQMMLPGLGEHLVKMMATNPRTALTEELCSLGLPDANSFGATGRLSSGQKRKLSLLAARHSCADLLLLDEPTDHLDASGLRWLLQWLGHWPRGLLVVSHDPMLLSHFDQFLVVAESGCRFYPGPYRELVKRMEKEAVVAQSRYARNLQFLERREEKRIKVLRRRQRKKNYGRISELERCTPRQRLNKKRGKAQVSQGKAARIAWDRIRAVRQQVSNSRRNLVVNFPLKVRMPALEAPTDKKLLLTEAVSATYDGRTLFEGLNLIVGHEKLAVVGPNGAGKTTLLNIMAGETRPCQGQVTATGNRGFISQGGENWMTAQSLLSLLMRHTALETGDAATQLLTKLKFPLALADRPLSTLSPRERVRAAVICLCHRQPAIHLLILDDPTYSLDAAGNSAMRKILRSWPGGLVLSSHNEAFLSSIGITRRLALDGGGGYTINS